MFKKFFDEFWPKAVEYVAEQGLNNVKNIKDFDHTLETLRKNLKLLSAKASDVEEEIKNGERSGRKKRKREVEEWLEDVRSIETEVDELGSQVESQGSVIMRLMDGGGKAALLNMKVERLVQQRLDFGEPVLDAFGTAEEILLTNGMVGKAFNQNRETVLELLENRQVSKIGVYGMGGIGKTTLAKQIYNRLVQQSQGRVFWITVSQEFTVRSLQDKIARCLGVGLSDEDEEAIRAGRLNRFLSQMKNSVLILDDVWERIDMLKVGCNFSVEGCRLIITTRSLEVCRQIGCKKLISVVKLCKDEAWKLFNETLENETELGPRVEEIAKSMTMLCGGLPLGIITVAGSMKGETAIHTWRNALAELEECVRGLDETGEVEEVFKVLKYSFDRLKRNVERECNGFNMIQHCFLYCSLYPEDFEIGRDDLARRFISEGLMDGRRSRRAQFEQGQSILDKLVNLCLLETCVDYRPHKCVKMHDLVRSMALRICKGIYMVRAGHYNLREIPKEEEWTKDLEKVSLMRCSIQRIDEGISPDCPKLSTLLLWWNIELKVIPDSFFCKMQGLCTLDLGGNSQIAMLPNSISDLACLKSLILEGCRKLKSVPYLGNMKALRELNLEGCRKLKSVPYLGNMKALRELNLSGTAIKAAPEGLEELLNLRFLSMNARRLMMLPKGLLLKLVHLEHLSIPLDMQVSTEEIEKLEGLEEFGGGVKSVSDFNKFVKSRAHDPSYRIGVSKNAVVSTIFKRGGKSGWPKNNELVLHECDLKDEKVLAKGVVSLTISRCKGVSKWFEDDLSQRFDNPTSLKTLYISNCGGMEWIMRSGGEGSQISTLEQIHLHLACLDDLKGVVGVMGRGDIPLSIGVASTMQPPSVFSSLRRLTIVNCNKMRKVGLPAASGVPNLAEISIDSCEKIQEIFKEDERRVAGGSFLPKLTSLKLIGLPRLGKVGLPVSGVPSLAEISIDSCEQIQEIFKEDEGRVAGSFLPKLTSLKLIGLPRLGKVGLPVSGVPSLAEISIDSCGEIQEIFKEDERRVVGGSFLPKLTSLKLIRLPRLGKVGLPVSGVPNLTEISIDSCEEIQEIFKEDDGRFAGAFLFKLTSLKLIGLPRLGKVGLPVSGVPSLAEISIDSCGEIQEIFKEDERRVAGGSFLPKLTSLKLIRLPRLGKVGLPVSGVPSLAEISIDSCGEIQEIFKEDERRVAGGSFLPKLTSLKLIRLPRLGKVGLPVSGVPNLTEISIDSCEEIQEIFKEDDGRFAGAFLFKLTSLKLIGLPRLGKVGLPVSGVPSLAEISIDSCGEIQEIFKEDERRVAGGSFLPKLTSLKLIRLPRLGKVGLPVSGVPNLTEISIDSCEEIQEIFKEDDGRFAGAFLFKLTSLKLIGLPRLGKVGLPVSGVPSLAEISIDSCGEIQEIFKEDERRVAGGSFLPKLTSLKLIGLPRLGKVGLPVSGVPSLAEISIDSCGEIQEIFKEDDGRFAGAFLPKLTSLKLIGLPRLGKVGLPVSGVPSLAEISIDSCGEIQEIFKEDERRVAGGSFLPKLTTLKLIRLPRLGKVGLPVSGVPNLTEISIDSCEEIEEIFEEEDEGRTASTLPKLASLTLQDLPKLKSVSKAVIISHSIQTIWIKECPELMSKLPLHFDVPLSPFLTYICVEREWWGSLDWDIQPNLPQLLQPFLHFH